MEKAAGWREEGEKLTLRIECRVKSKRFKGQAFPCPGERFDGLVALFPAFVSGS